MTRRSHLLSFISVALALALTGGCKDSDDARVSSSSATTSPSSTTESQTELLAVSAYPGEVAGIVRMDGSAPALQPIDVSSCADCLKIHPNGVADETIMKQPTGALQNVVVYLENDSAVAPNALAAAAALAPAQLDQVGCRYEPHVVALQAGQKLNVISSDPFVHNVHGQAVDNPAFNFSDRQKTLSFALPETFPVRCDVHPWMKAWIAVFPNPWFSVTDSAGVFRLRNVPPGHYTLMAWHERLGRLRREIDVVKDQPLRIGLVYAR